MKTSNKKIPKSLKECCETDYVAKDLWHWSWQVEEWGKKLTIIMAVIGVISTIAEFAMTVDYYEALAISNLFASIIKWAMYILLTYIGYHILSILIASLATVVQNTRVIADVALYKASGEEVFEDEETLEKEAKVSKPEIKYKHTVDKVKINPDGTWTCKGCGQKNNSEVLNCKGCGRYR